MVKVTILDKDKDLKPEMSAKVTFLEPDKKSEQKAARGAGGARGQRAQGRRRRPATASRRSSSTCARARR